MRAGATLSAILHLAVVLAAWIGLPLLADPPIVPETIPVEVVASVPKEQTKPEEPKPAPEPKEEAAAPPEPPPPAPAPPAAQPIPEPKAEVVPPPTPVLKPQKPEPPKETAKAEPAFEPKTQEKPQPPVRNLMASVLKTVEQIKTETTKKERRDPAAEQAPSKETPQVSSLDRQRREQQLSDLVRQQMRQCWNFDPGGKDVRSMVAEIRIQLAPDGTVQRAELLDRARVASDGFYRAFAESAMRAVLNPRCNPMKLPPEHYEIWRDMTLVFSPKDLV